MRDHYLLKENPGIDFFLSQGLNYDKNGKLMLRGNPKKKDYINEFITFQTAFQTTAPTWHKSFLMNIGMWNENIKRWQDPEIHIRALIKTKNVVWKSEIPDYAITVDNDDESKITDVTKAIENYDNLVAAYIFSINLLNEKYVSLFKEHISHQVWCFGEHINFAQLKLVSQRLYHNQIFNKTSYKRYLFIISLMIVFKKIPLVRKIVYRQIKKNTSNFEHYKEYKDVNVIKIFKEDIAKFKDYTYLNGFLKILSK